VIIESVAFGLVVKFFEYLNKNQIDSSSIRISLFDGTKRQHLTFATYSDLIDYNNSNYRIFKKCEVGDTTRIESFRATSSLYGFTTVYIVSDVCGDTSIINGGDYDINRNESWNVFKEKQTSRLNSIINKYKNFCRELYNIHANGIYSPCYAEPGWSEGTSRLRELKDLVIINGNIFN
jgi:hypothetical protein